jgi:proline iminopeptidase
MNGHVRHLGAFVLLLLGCIVRAPSATGVRPEEHGLRPPEDAGPQGSYIRVGDHRIWYASEGHGEPLLLIPGGPGYSHDYFLPYFSRLKDAYRIIYYDPFGTGRSERARNAAEYSLVQEIDEVEGLRKALHITRWDIFGHSWGGAVAQGYVIKYPGSVSHLIVSDSPVSGASLQESNNRVNGLIRELFPDNWNEIQALRAKGFKSSSAEMGKVAPPILRYLTRYHREDENPPSPNSQAFNPEISLAIMGADMDFELSGDAAHFDWRKGLGQVEDPILILNGRADLLITPRQAEEIRDAAPRSRLVILERSGHFGFSAQTDISMKTIRDFLEQRP